MRRDNLYKDDDSELREYRQALISNVVTGKVRAA